MQSCESARLKPPTSELVTSRANSKSFYGVADYSDVLGFHTPRKGCLMWVAFFLFWKGPPRPGGADLARFALLT